MRRIMDLRLIVGVLLFASCEEVIHVDLNAADRRYVIEAELTNIAVEQTIRVSQTVPFDSSIPSQPVDEAHVEVVSSGGRVYRFDAMGEGYYRNDSLQPREELSYMLRVRIGDEEFVATEAMQPFVDVDSLGALEEIIFNEKTYSILVKFTDPLEENNYYKYLVSVNQQPLRFLQVQNDKYNNGLYVTHQLMDFSKPFELGDSIIVRRQSVSKAVHDYWNEIQLLNPGSAAPANPKSNISNGAFGYFSISNSKDFGLTIRASDFYKDENE